MIEYVKGDLLQADVEALVNPVNCVGVMGKGLALEFKRVWPEMFAEYAAVCRRGELRPGGVLVWRTGKEDNPQCVINFPTKRHWRDRSRVDDVASGLAALVGVTKRRGIRSLAVPALGCGNGGLDWPVVRAMIERAMAALPDVRVLVYAPQG